MTDRIIDGTQMDTSVFSYSAPKAYPKGGKVVNLYNKHFKESLTIATPLILTWGAQEGLDQMKNPTGKFTMSLQFPTPDYSNDDLTSFLASMKAVEEKVKADALVYSKDWFGKNISSPEVMDEKFNVMLRHPKVRGTQEIDLSKPPTLTVKIPCWNGVWQSEIYDEDGETLFTKNISQPNVSPLDFIKSKTQVICLIQCGGLWFVNGKVSITWNLKQAIVQKPKVSMEGRCLLKIKSSDKEKLQKMEAPEESPMEEMVSSTIVEDSDDDDDDDDNNEQQVDEGYSAVKLEEVVVETPEPVVEKPVEVKKKRIIKKKVPK